MEKVLAGYMFIVLLLVGCSANEQENTEKSAPIAELEVITENLDAPWSIEKQGNTFYLTERAGLIIEIENREAVQQSVELDKELATVSEAGLLGFVLAPDFAESNQAYAYYTYRDSDGQFNRIITLRLENDVWREERLLLDKIPSGSYHHGGRIKIGPDGKIYATAGDASERETAQDLNSLGGKILRMNLDGSIPNDNPFSDSYVYSYGHRNPQGMTWSSEGMMYATEHGESANDEVNLIEAGQNYGWPIIEGEEGQVDMISPLLTSGNEKTWAPSGMDYDDSNLYVAALRGTAILGFSPETGEQWEVVTELGRIRDVLIEDNYLYFITNNTDGRGTPEENDDKLYRMNLSESN